MSKFRKFVLASSVFVLSGLTAANISMAASADTNPPAKPAMVPMKVPTISRRMLISRSDQRRTLLVMYTQEKLVALLRRA